MADEQPFTYQFPNRRILALRPSTRRAAGQRPVLSPVVEDAMGADELEALLEAEFDAQEAEAASSPMQEQTTDPSSPAGPTRTTPSGLKLPGPGSRLKAVMSAGDMEGYSPSTPTAGAFGDVSMTGSDQVPEPVAHAPLQSPTTAWSPSPRNPFYGPNTTFKTMAAAIHNALKDAADHTHGWVINFTSPAELLALSHEPDSPLVNVLEQLTWTAELLSHPEQSPFPLLRLPDRFFSDVLPFAHAAVEGLGLLANMPDCELLLGRSVQEAGEIFAALRRIQAARWEIGIAREEEEKRIRERGGDGEGDVSMGDD
ncbi:hypothetical protein B0A48_05522 [Cryoendolithus antarcticus]|uniref:Uncharacterized protein n=1 Tax=Cryoendolithus antarcticus TaxID=1507870 RepID=A0A1V8TIS7_9PEZI|nr:hypothetical protein B0A48_05522 [Cryoendolithus antarcticus]